MQLLVLGLGNLLLQDDGVGVRAVEQLSDRYFLPDGVEVVDGGTLGLALLSVLAEAERAILVDAVRADGAPAGALVRLSGEQVPAAVATRLSPHQVGVADLLLGAHLIERHPRELVLCGVVPAAIELGVGLTPAVDAALPALVAAVAAECGSLGFPLTEMVPATPLRRRMVR